MVLIYAYLTSCQQLFTILNQGAFYYLPVGHWLLRPRISSVSVSVSVFVFVSVSVFTLYSVKKTLLCHEILVLSLNWAKMKHEGATFKRFWQITHSIFCGILNHYIDLGVDQKILANHLSLFFNVSFDMVGQLGPLAISTISQS